MGKNIYLRLKNYQKPDYCNLPFECGVKGKFKLCERFNDYPCDFDSRINKK